jgi:hypothetical protein
MEELFDKPILCPMCCKKQTGTKKVSKEEYEANKEFPLYGESCETCKEAMSL